MSGETDMQVDSTVLFTPTAMLSQGHIHYTNNRYRRQSTVQTFFVGDVIATTVAVKDRTW